MESNKINAFCIQIQDKVDPMGIVTVRSTLDKMDDDKYDAAIASLGKLKDPTTVFLLSLFLGQYGVDRFVLGKIGSGICKLIFGWLTLGIWWLVDVIKAKEKTKQYNSQAISRALLCL